MIPILIVKIYRLIPVPIRKLWGFGGAGTSHLALAALEAGGSWKTLFSYMHLVTVPPFKNKSWSSPSQSVGIAWKLGEGGKGSP